MTEERNMRRGTGVQKKRKGSDNWPFAIKAPKELRHLYQTQWAHRQSLGTADLRVALERASVLRAEWLGKFAAQRLALAGKVTDADGPAVLARVRATLDNLVRVRLAAFDFEASTMTPGQREEAEEGLDALHDHAQPAAEGHTEPEQEAHDLLTEALKAAGLHSESMTPKTHRACLAAAQTARARLLVLQSEALEYTGNTGPKRRALLGDTTQQPVPVVPVLAGLAAPNSNGKGHTPRDAFNAWAALPGKSGKVRPKRSLNAYRTAADRLAGMLKGKPLEAMTREDGRDFVATLLADAQAKGGTAQNTAVNILSKWKTLLAQAVDVEWIDKNPLQGRTIARVKSPRKPWTIADLVRLFDHPTFTSYAIPTSARAGLDAAYWLPLLGLYTGARITELAQLGIDDLVNTQDAGWVLSIHEEGEDQRVKNTHSVRRVPVHPELIRLGLVDYWQAVKALGATRLFPAAVFSDTNGAGGEVSKHFSSFKTAQGFGGPELVFHSFRHTLETGLRALSVPKYHIKALAGHAPEDISDGYSHPTPDVLRPHLERLAFPGLVLHKVFTAPAWTPEKPQKPRKPRAVSRTRPAPAAKP